jgi:hypothetical protein
VYTTRELAAPSRVRAWNPSIKFEYPNDTPHLDDEQREAYLVQIKERDERVGAQRAKAKAERIEKLRQEEADAADTSRPEL